MIDERDDELLQACVDGELNPDDQERFARVVQNPEARQELDRLRALSAMLDAEPDDIDPPPGLVDDVLRHLPISASRVRTHDKPAWGIRWMLGR